MQKLPSKNPLDTTRNFPEKVGTSSPARRRVKQVQCGMFLQGSRARFGHFEGFLGFLAIASWNTFYALNSSRRPFFEASRQGEGMFKSLQKTLSELGVGFEGLEVSRLVTCLDGRNRAIVIAKSLERVIAAIRITSIRWRSYLAQKHRIWSLETLRSFRCGSNHAIGVHWRSIHSTWNCGIACES